MKHSILLTLSGILLSFSAMANDTIRIYSNGCDDYQTFIGSHGSQLTMTANSDQWSHFVRWNDGNTKNPRTITTNGNASYIAYFEAYKYSMQVQSNDTARGRAYISKVVKDGTIDYNESVGTFEAGSKVYLACQANYGYHFDKWSDGNRSQQRSFILTKDTTFTATFAKNVYYITKNAEHGSISGNNSAEYLDFVTLTVTPDYGYHFVRWNDGNTDNPRTIQLTQDTTMEAIFDYLLTSKCGKDSALTWTFEPASMALNITGKGALSENYTYGTFIESLTIGNEVTTIGEAAFYKCANLKNVIIGSSVKVLEESAFYDCSAIESFTCYGQRPPTVNQNALYGLDYSTIVYVPADYFETYNMHDAWGLYDVRPLGAKSTETTDVNVTPAENTADVAWPAVSEAATYELVIKDKNGNVICTLTFNAKGQLTQIAFNAPSRNNTPQHTQTAGFSFTVTGLNSGTTYNYTLTTKDSGGNVIDTQAGSFKTAGTATDIEDVSNSAMSVRKVMRDGVIYLLMPDGRMYDMQGAEVR